MRPEQLALELANLQLQVGDLGPIVGGFGAGGGKFGLSLIACRDRFISFGPRGDQRRLQGVNVVRQGVGGKDPAPY